MVVKVLGYLHNLHNFWIMPQRARVAAAARMTAGCWAVAVAAGWVAAVGGQCRIQSRLAQANTPAPCQAAHVSAQPHRSMPASKDR